ncbi:MAG TPA: IclR family transcriptional regulator C-terminal domain-containing protein, partial [Ideonella sp.]|nr:IclR family transcriptional regulator C-terminal domain-containing protein [Ideonella sp.]
AVWGNFGPTVVRMVEAQQPLHVAMRVGTVMALFGTATGRAFVGALPRERVVKGLQGPLGAGGNSGLQAPVSDKTLDAEISVATAELRVHGVTRAVGKPIPGVNAFSAPVRDHEGQPVLVITALGHQDHVPSAWSSPIARAVRAAAADVSARLGYREAGDTR